MKLIPPVAFVLLLACLLALGCGSTSSSITDSGSVDPAPTIQYLFVQSAESGTFVQSPNDADVYILSLKGARPNTTYFSDRPYRLTGYIATADFVGSWNDTSDDNFLKDPPNAALQIDGAPPTADVIIVELEDVFYDEPTGTLRYRARIVRKAKDSVELFHARGDSAENIPASFGPASLFIDSWASKAWHKVKKAASDVSDDVKKDASDADAKLKKAVTDFEQGVKDSAKSLDALASDPSKMMAMTNDAFHRLISLALPPGIGACLAVVPGPPPFDPTTITPPSMEHINWMSKLSATIANRELRNVAMPGSHDSGTYPISGLSPLPSELSQGELWVDGVLLAVNVLRDAFPSTYPIAASIANWSRAQRHSIAAQLEAGVRYFDLRMLPDPSGLTFVATHGFAGAEFTPMLVDLTAFLALYPKEVVILDFQHLFSRLGKDNGMSREDAEALLDRIVLALGTKVVTKSVTANPKDMTMSDLWQKGLQVVVLFDPAAYDRMSSNAQQKVWKGGGEVINRYWPNKESWDLTLSFLNAEISNINTDAKLVVVQTQMTPNIPLVEYRSILGLTIGTITAQFNCLKTATGISLPADLFSSIKAHLDRLIAINVPMSLKEEAAVSNPQLKTWLQQHKPRRIVIADFIVDYPDTITAIIEANK